MLDPRAAPSPLDRRAGREIATERSSTYLQGSLAGAAATIYARARDYLSRKESSSPPGWPHAAQVTRDVLSAVLEVKVRAREVSTHSRLSELGGMLRAASPLRNSFLQRVQHDAAVVAWTADCRSSFLKQCAHVAGFQWLERLSRVAKHGIDAQRQFDSIDDCLTLNLVLQRQNIDGEMDPARPKHDRSTHKRHHTYGATSGFLDSVYVDWRHRRRGLRGLLVVRKRHRECAVKPDPERRWDAIDDTFKIKLAP